MEEERRPAERLLLGNHPRIDYRLPTQNNGAAITVQSIYFQEQLQ